MAKLFHDRCVVSLQNPELLEEEKRHRSMRLPKFVVLGHHMHLMVQISKRRVSKIYSSDVHRVDDAPNGPQNDTRRCKALKLFIASHSNYQCTFRPPTQIMDYLYFTSDIWPQDLAIAYLYHISSCHELTV
jgi:hypothetical protein